MQPVMQSKGWCRSEVCSVWCRWADVLSTELVAGASARPLLSGYYRMMAMVLSLAEQAGLLGQTAEQRAHPSAFQQVHQHAFHTS